MKARPEHLPDFTSPPLNEVVLGVQFAPIQGYSSVKAKDVWELFKDEFPIVREQPPLTPIFETFDDAPPRPSIQWQVESEFPRSRLWLVGENSDHLIQFQEDRFLLNWRKSGDSSHYPRFEKVADMFEKYFYSLNSFFTEDSDASLKLNQIEVSYINLIRLDSYNEVTSWLRFISDWQVRIETFSIAFSEVIRSDNHPPARLRYELQSMADAEGKNKALGFSLRFRGSHQGKTSHRRWI